MNFFSMIGEWIAESIRKGDFVSASLQIDQLIDLIPNQPAEIKEFWIYYIVQYMIEMGTQLGKVKSIAGQVGNLDYNQNEFIQRIQNLEQQKLELKTNYFDHCFVYIVDETGSNKNQFVNKILQASIEKKIRTKSFFYFMSKKPGIYLPGLTITLPSKKNSFTCIPVKSLPQNNYEQISLEYYITETFSYIERELEYVDKNLLLAFEFIPTLSEKEKEKFYRALIRIILLSYINNRSIEFKKINIYFDSEADAGLFNTELGKITNLISYYSVKNMDVDESHYLFQHPYIKEKRINLTDLKADKIINPVNNKTGTSVPRQIRLIPDTLQGKVKTNSVNYNNLLAELNEVVKLDLNLLLLGDTGVGKGELAKQIHKTSERKGPFKHVNCSAIPSELIDSELFGSKKGGFTGAVARKGKIEATDGGTVFLDEIGKAPLVVQYKLLTFIQDKNYSAVGSDETKTANVRLIFASNENLNQLISDGKMLEEFYYRIAEPSFIIPSLHERSEDIESFVNYFVNLYQEKFLFSLKISESALIKMKEFKWPGNIRQIENTIIKIFQYCKPNKIEELTAKELDLIRWNVSVKNQKSAFKAFEDSYESLFQIYLERIREFESISLNQNMELTKKYESNNSHSFLKLVIEPIAANNYKTLNLGTKKATKYLGLDWNNGLNSVLEQRAILYSRVSKLFGS